MQLLGHSENYGNTTASPYQYARGEPNANIAIPASFQFENWLPGSAPGTNNVTIDVPLKYPSLFW